MINLSKEVIQEENLQERVNHRFRVLKEIYDLPEELTRWEAVRFLHRRAQSREQLKLDYRIICEKLRKKFPLEMSRTPAEDRFVEYFRKHWRIHLYPQTWIGNFCLDWFTPALAERLEREDGEGRFKGVAIEVDGAIHNVTSKMKIDSFKEQGLNDLKIGLWRFTNYHVFSKSGLPTKLSLGNAYVRLCSHDRKRLWSRIYLLTIIYHGDDDVLKTYFPRLFVGEVNHA